MTPSDRDPRPWRRPFVVGDDDLEDLERRRRPVDLEAFESDVHGAATCALLAVAGAAGLVGLFVGIVVGVAVSR